MRRALAVLSTLVASMLLLGGQQVVILKKGATCSTPTGLTGTLTRWLNFDSGDSFGAGDDYAIANGTLEFVVAGSDTTGARTVSASGEVTIVDCPARVGKCLKVTMTGGTSGYMAFSPTSAEYSATEGTVGLMVYSETSTSGNSNLLYLKRSGMGDQLGLDFYGTTGDFTATHASHGVAADQAFWSNLSPLLLMNGEWHYLTVSYKTTATEELKVYGDGTLGGTSDTNITAWAGAPDTLGFGTVGPTTTRTYYLDNIAVTDKAGEDLFAVVCGDDPNCLAGQAGDYCQEPAETPGFGSSITLWWSGEACETTDRDCTSADGYTIDSGDKEFSAGATAFVWKGGDTANIEVGRFHDKDDRPLGLHGIDINMPTGGPATGGEACMALDNDSGFADGLLQEDKGRCLVVMQQGATPGNIVGNPQILFARNADSIGSTMSTLGMQWSGSTDVWASTRLDAGAGTDCAHPAGAAADSNPLAANTRHAFELYWDNTLGASDYLKIDANMLTGYCSVVTALGDINWGTDSWLDFGNRHDDDSGAWRVGLVVCTSDVTQNLLDLVCGNSLECDGPGAWGEFWKRAPPPTPSCTTVPNETEYGFWADFDACGQSGVTCSSSCTADWTYPMDKWSLLQNQDGHDWAYEDQAIPAECNASGQNTVVLQGSHSLKINEDGGNGTDPARVTGTFNATKPLVGDLKGSLHFLLDVGAVVGGAPLIWAARKDGSNYAHCIFSDADDMSCKYVVAGTDACAGVTVTSGNYLEVADPVRAFTFEWDMTGAGATDICRLFENGAVIASKTDINSAGFTWDDANDFWLGSDQGGDTGVYYLDAVVGTLTTDAADTVDELFATVCGNTTCTGGASQQGKFCD